MPRDTMLTMHALQLTAKCQAEISLERTEKAHTQACAMCFANVHW